MKKIVYSIAVILLVNLTLILFDFWKILKVTEKGWTNIVVTSILFLLILGVFAWLENYKKDEKSLEEKNIIN